MANFSGSHENPEPQQRSARPRFVGEATIRIEGPACRARSEERACHARRSAMDNQTLFGGPDKQVPPKGKSEGPACRAREIGMDCQKGHFADLPIGLIKHTPPT